MVSMFLKMDMSAPLFISHTRSLALSCAARAPAMSPARYFWYTSTNGSGKGPEQPDTVPSQPITSAERKR